MSEAKPAWFRNHVQSPSFETVHASRATKPGLSATGRACKSPVPEQQTWFSPIAPTPSLEAAQHADSAAYSCQQPRGFMPPPQLASETSETSNSHSAGLSQFAGTRPGILLPVSQRVSHASIPGPALRPCSPWRQTSAQQTTLAPSVSGTSVIVATDKQQPSLAEALGFADKPLQPTSTGPLKKTAAVTGSGLLTAPHASHYVDARHAEITPAEPASNCPPEQAVTTGQSPHPGQQIKSGQLSQPQLQKLVDQVEAAYLHCPAKFDAFLQLSHQYQAQKLDTEHFDKQVSKPFWPSCRCDAASELACQGACSDVVQGQTLPDACAVKPCRQCNVGQSSGVLFCTL